MNLLARLLHTLGNIADSQDCDRPSEALDLLLSQSHNYKPDELEQLHRELNTMKAVIGDLSLQINDLKNKKDGVTSNHTVIPLHNENKKQNLHP